MPGREILCGFCNAAGFFLSRHEGGQFFRLHVSNSLQMGGGYLHEITGRQTLRCHRWSPDKREPGGCILEQVEGHCQPAPDDLVGVGRHNRFSPPAR